MTILEYQELYKKDKESAKKKFASLSKSELKSFLETCGTPQMKLAMKQSWERLSGNKY